MLTKQASPLVLCRLRKMKDRLSGVIAYLTGSINNISVHDRKIGDLLCRN